MIPKEELDKMVCHICGRKLQQVEDYGTNLYRCDGNVTSHILIDKDYLYFYLEKDGYRKRLALESDGTLHLSEDINANIKPFPHWKSIIEIPAEPGYFRNMIEIIDSKLNIDKLLIRLEKIILLK